ncbi:MauE/DoxX family redox-associated membrane protein [Archangium violaceum]|uniref:MauE/DoxX family redox-associated membrane protein n=1 Tax=Archangium violaceum TaxID=83451 RepID=UPI0037C019FF
MSAVDLGCRLMLSVVLTLAFASKVRNRSSFQDFIQTLGRFGFPKPWVGSPLAAAVVLAEAASALLLLLTSLAGYVLALALFTGFTLGIARVLRRGERVRCRCFGASDTPMGASHLVRNGLLIAVTLAGAVGHEVGPPSSPLSVAGWGAGALGVLAGFFITRWDDLVFLLHGPEPMAGPPAAARKQRG